MAEVWAARTRGKHGFTRLFAIKTILEEYEGGDAFRKMFLDEARIASRIQHQNVAQILDVGEENGLPYLVLEYVDGDSLSALRRTVERRGIQFPIGIALRIMADTCGGLAAAHSLRDDQGNDLQVVHRDVSPQNILVSTDGMVKLIDFGIAKARERIADVTSTGMLKGKIEFMSPEQAEGRAVDHRSDLWSIGAIAYLLIAGRPAYPREDDASLLRLLESGAPPAPLPSTVPEPVRAVVSSALEHDPEKRVASASALQRAIEDAIVATGLHTTSADVAAFIATHLGDRAQRRKLTIDQAIAASGMASGEFAPVSEPPLPGQPLAAFPPEDASAPPPPAPILADSSSLESSMMEADRPSFTAVRRRNRKVVFGVVGAAALVLVVGGAISFARRQSEPSKDREKTEKTREEPEEDREPAAKKTKVEDPPEKSEEVPTPKASSAPSPAPAETTAKPPPPLSATATATAKPTATASTTKPKPTVPTAVPTTKKKPPVINEGF